MILKRVKDALTPDRSDAGTAFMMGLVLAGSDTVVSDTREDVPRVIDVSSTEAWPQPKYNSDFGPEAEHDPDATNVLDRLPAEKKLAIIVNGDNEEERHIENVQRAMETLHDKGFRRFMVVADQGIDVGKLDRSLIFHYPGTIDGLDVALHSLEDQNRIKEDDLIFFYATGHGDYLPEYGAGLALGEEIYTLDLLVEHLEVIKEQRARIIAVTDECYGGSLPYQIMDAGIEGQAFSPGTEGELTACQYFSPDLFRAMREDFDLNQDGTSEPAEWWNEGMLAYNQALGTYGGGTYAETRTQLDSGNVEEVLKADKPTLVLISYDSISSVSLRLSKELYLMGAFNGEHYDIAELSVDERDDAAEVLEKLGLQHVVAPAYLLVNEGEAQVISQGQDLPIQLLDLEMKHHGISTGVPQAPEPILRSWVLDYPDFFMDKPELIPEDMTSYDGLVTMVENGDFEDVILLYPYYEKQEWGADLFQKAVESAPLTAFKYYAELIAGKDWGVHLMKYSAQESPVEMVPYLYAVRNEPWVKDILIEVVDIGYSELVIEYLFIDFLDMPWAGEVAQNIARMKPEYLVAMDKEIRKVLEYDAFVEKYPWYKEIISELNE